MQEKSLKTPRLIPEFVANAKDLPEGRASEYHKEPRVRSVVEHEGFIIAYASAEFGAQWAIDKTNDILKELDMLSGLTHVEVMQHIRTRMKEVFEKVKA